MQARSLTKRVISLSLLWIAIALVVTAVLLSRFYRQHIEEHFDAHVFTHVEELVAAVETGPDGALTLSREPTDPRFYRPNSGWYWEVLSADNLLQKSVSLGDHRLDLSNLTLDESHGVQSVLGPGDQKLRAHVVHVSYPHDTGSLTVVATVPELQITEDVYDFAAQVMMSFLVLGIGLVVAVVVQVTVALKPLKAIKSGISDIRAGKTKRLPSNFPSDVQPLVDEMNFLLDHNETLLKRARNQLGDLAHAIKNPLSVIRNEARGMSGKQGQLILDQSHVMANSMDHYLSRARIYGKQDALGYRTSVRPILDDLSYAVEHIHKGRGIKLQMSCQEDRFFRGEAQDLEEMVGNLIDNAFKWANREVQVRCESNQKRLSIIIEDDGPGIAEEDLDDVIRRGRKLVDSVPGHGHGLGIVTDIAELYGGSLTLSRSELGGLKTELDLPAA